MGTRGEISSGDLSRKFVGGTAQIVEDGAKARDGELFVFLSADWSDHNYRVPNLQIAKNVEIPVHTQIMDNLIMCSCIIVMCGKQVGPLHLALVAHCREFLWRITPPEMTRRMVEGSGMVDYLNIMWCIDSEFRLYRNVTESVGLSEYQAAGGGRWDAFWYIYRRGDNTPGYSHIGLDHSATLNNQKHVAAKLKEAVEEVPEIRAVLRSTEDASVERKSGRNSIFGNLFRAKSSRSSG